MKKYDIKKIKTKEQLRQFIEDTIAGEISFIGTTKHDTKRLEWVLSHLEYRDKVAPEDPKVICDLLRVLYNFCEDDKLSQQLILIITSMASCMQQRLKMKHISQTSPKPAQD